jgi:superfamily II DNA/RNA helicase
MTNIKFNDMNISDNVKRALSEKGYEEATAIQTEAIGPILDGLDVLGLAQTGTGKTGAFAIPIIKELIQKMQRFKPLFYVQQENLFYKYVKKWLVF